MQCYECAKTGKAVEAVATCWSCSAGLCLAHVRQAALQMQTGAIRVACDHDTWVPMPARAGGAPAVPAR
jgi:hypothetical protein